MEDLKKPKPADASDKDGGKAKAQARLTAFLQEASAFFARAATQLQMRYFSLAAPPVQ